MLKNIAEEFKRFKEVFTNYKQDRTLRIDFLRFMLVMIIKISLWLSMFYLGYIIIVTFNIKTTINFILLILIWFFNQKIHKKLCLFMDADASEDEYLIVEKIKLEEKLEILNKKINELKKEGKL